MMDPDTDKGIRNVFDALYLPWESFPDTVKSVGKVIADHYDKNLRELYWDAVKQNIMYDTYRRGRLSDSFKVFIRDEKPIFYGLGQQFRSISEIVNLDEVLDDVVLADRMANEMVEYKGRGIMKPEDAINIGGSVIVFIYDNNEYEIIKKSIHHDKVFRGLWDYLTNLVQKKEREEWI